MASQHGSLSPERWAVFTLDQQLLMIANEMNRGRKLMAPGDRPLLDGCYERALRLLDLTIQVQERYGLRRELLRWRDLVAELYVSETPRSEAHDVAFLCLLKLHPTPYQQIPLLFPRSQTPS